MAQRRDVGDDARSSMFNCNSLLCVADECDILTPAACTAGSGKTGKGTA